jgi:hypothetical protein
LKVGAGITGLQPSIINHQSSIATRHSDVIHHRRGYGGGLTCEKLHQYLTHSGCVRASPTAPAFGLF